MNMMSMKIQKSQMSMKSQMSPTIKMSKSAKMSKTSKTSETSKKSKMKIYMNYPIQAQTSYISQGESPLSSLLFLQ